MSLQVKAFVLHHKEKSRGASKPRANKSNEKEVGMCCASMRGATTHMSAPPCLPQQDQERWPCEGSRRIGRSCTCALFSSLCVYGTLNRACYQGGRPSDTAGCFLCGFPLLRSFLRTHPGQKAFSVVPCVAHQPTELSAPLVFFSVFHRRVFV